MTDQPTTVRTTSWACINIRRCVDLEVVTVFFRSGRTAKANDIYCRIGLTLGLTLDLTSIPQALHHQFSIKRVPAPFPLIFVAYSRINYYVLYFKLLYILLSLRPSFRKITMSGLVSPSRTRPSMSCVVVESVPCTYVRTCSYIALLWIMCNIVWRRSMDYVASVPYSQYSE